MMHKTYKAIRKTLHFSKGSVRYSALFVNGPKATENYIHVQPHVDFKTMLENKEKIQQDLEKRQININFKKLEDVHGVYRDLETQKEKYEKKKQELSKELNLLLKLNQDEANINKFKIQIDLIKDNIKKLKMPLWSVEENAVLEYLKMPNALHSLTPDKEIKIIHNHLSPPKTQKDHLKIGTNLNLLVFKKNENYYLKNDAAIFELGAKFHYSNVLKQHGFIQFSNPDFVKSLIIEGCGHDHTDSNTTFILHHSEDSKPHVDNRLHLTGGGSIYSFMAYMTKTRIPSKYLPLQYFSMGRQYQPSSHDEDSLFHVSQSSVIHVFQAAHNQAELDGVFDSCIEVIKTLYTSLGYHYRLVLQPANQLKMWESARLSIEMYSTSQKKYIEVGNLSISGDFISKRLNFTYVDKKTSVFPFLMSGVVLNVSKLLACVLEQDGDFEIPKQFQVENWSLSSSS